MYSFLFEKVLQKPDIYYDPRVGQNTVNVKENILERTENDLNSLANYKAQIRK